MIYVLVITRNQIARSISSYKSVQRKTKEFHEKSKQTGMRMKSEIKHIYSKNETNSCKVFYKLQILLSLEIIDYQLYRYVAHDLQFTQNVI